MEAGFAGGEGPVASVLRELRAPNEQGVTELGEESIRIAEDESPHQALSESVIWITPRDDGLGSSDLARLPFVERCAALRNEGRLVEAMRVARAGLAADGDAGPLLLELSRAQAGLGRLDEAIDTARDALFVWESREGVEHLIGLCVPARSFAPEDGAIVRREAVRHPQEPLLLHAVGLFESQHGSPLAAETQLRAALAVETDPERRAAIERDLARVEEVRAKRQPGR